jgi:hypothetical protein
MQEEPAVEPALGDGFVVRVIFEAFANALIDWWYLWLILVVGAIALRMLADWSKRVEARARAARRASERIERESRPRGTARR